MHAAFLRGRNMLTKILDSSRFFLSFMCHKSTQILGKEETMNDEKEHTTYFYPNLL